MTIEAADTRSGSGQPGPSRRRLARLGAVQALYQAAITGESVEQVVEQFLKHRLGEEMDGVVLDADRGFFLDLLRGTLGRREQIDEALRAALTGGERDFARIEVILRAILRAGTYELLARSDVPARVVIKEYVDMAADFFSAGEASLVNGVLDRIAHVVRAEEAGLGSRGDDTPAG